MPSGQVQSIPNETFLLNVQTPFMQNGISIFVKAPHTVLYVKGTIKLIVGIPKSEMNLSFGGVLMENERSLYHYGIVGDATVQMSLPIRGGGGLLIGFEFGVDGVVG